ncbi:MAG: hypothetical protein Q4C53_04090 [Clostridia bacterium]|nr:hypothetical protein [Clostridia bacterium]
MERNNKVFRTVMGACCGVLALALAGAGVKYFTRKFVVGRLGIRNAVTERIASVNSPNDNRKTVAEGALLPGFTAFVYGIEEKVEAALGANLPLGQAMTEGASALEAKLGLTLGSPDDPSAVDELEGGYLIGRNAKIGDTQLPPMMERLRQTGKPLLFVCTPGKACKVDDAGYDGVLNFDNARKDERLAVLTEAGFGTFDLREAFHAAGFVHHSLFYRTDHHWLPEAACTAARFLAEELNARFGLAIPDGACFDIGNYEEERFEALFLGSNGRKLTLGRCAPEDFSLWSPKFETEYRIRIPSEGLDLTGTHEVLFDRRHLARGDYYRTNPYTAYLRGNTALTQVTNLKRPEGAKLLFIGDSFDNALLNFFVNAVAECAVLDTRMWAEEDAFWAWIAEHAESYDAIVVSGEWFAFGTLL